MSKYIVAIGDDIFEVDAEDNQGARYSAAEQFKTKYKLTCSLSSIAVFAKTRMVPEPPEPVESTKDVLKALKAAQQ